MKGRRAIVVIGAALVGTALAPASASAEERTCRGSLGAVTVDNLRVPQGASCTLTGTRVKGTIKVERRATLRARGVRVIGNVQGENARRVDVIRGSRIGGSVQVKQGGAARVLDSRVNADIQYDANREAATSCRATRRTSALGSERLNPRSGLIRGGGISVPPPRRASERTSV